MFILIPVLILFLTYSFFAILSMKWSNHFKLIFLFGKKGSGKSTLLVKYMYKYACKGYTIYTNMSDCMWPGARIIRIEDIGDFIPEPFSLLCLDEVGIYYDARKFKTFKDSTRDFYKLQRHYKVVVLMTSQTWDVDKKVRDLCDNFYAITALGPLSIGKQIKRKTVVTEASSEGESRIADNLKFTSPLSWNYTWLPRWHRYFDSFIAPERPYVHFQTVPGQLPERVVKKQKKKKHTLDRKKESAPAPTDIDSSIAS